MSDKEMPKRFTEYLSDNEVGVMAIAGLICDDVREGLTMAETPNDQA